VSLADEVAVLGKGPPHLTATGSWRVTTDPDGGGAVLENDGTEQHLVAADDWDGVLRHFGLNPAEFEIDGTVRMSSWQQSKRLDNGDRDEVTLYSYRARFRQIGSRLSLADLADLRTRVHQWKPTRPAVRAGVGVPSTFYVAWADWQIGKEGVALTTQRVLDSFEQSVARVKELRRLGRNVTRLAVWNMGDPTEGCDGQYASQLFTVELTRREQLNLALDLWLTGLRTLAPLFDEVEFGSVLCNHGEWSRTGYGTKPVTSDSDNIGGYLADTLQRVLADRPEFSHVRYSVPGSEMTKLTTMSGVPVALCHGHKTPGSAKELEWMQAQSLRLLREHGREPRLWMTAHRHHYEIKDHGPWTRVQMPALDLGSKWYADAVGKWSSPGTFTCLVGEHAQAGGPLSGMGRGFSDEMVLVPTE
jgi:hypothetical protein